MGRGALAGIVVALCLAASASAAPGPKLRTPAKRLGAALTCPKRFTHPAHEPVLLVHGTATDSEDSWSWNYGKVLPELGYDTCWVDIPGRELGDIQTSSEYVVYAIRRMAKRSGRKVDVIGHSQGTLEPRWAIRWWPDVARSVDDDVSLAGPHHGVNAADSLCATGACPPAVWQMRSNSNLLRALNAGDETWGSVSYTAIASQTDELVQPYSTASLDGAVNLLIQDYCPGRPIHHAGQLEDAVVFRWVMSALSRPGPADPAAVQPQNCLELTLPGAGNPVAGNAALYGNAAVALATGPFTGSEPPLRPYARR